jgi:hypothetical protein
MSIVGQGAFALVPSASSPEGLTKRLLALRTEIDAILVELVSHAMAKPQQGAAMPAMTVAPAILAEALAPAKTVARAAPEQTSEPALIAPPSDEKPQPEPCDADEAEVVCEPASTAVEPAASLEAPELICAVASELPVAVAAVSEPSEAHEPLLLAQEGESTALEDVQPHIAEPLAVAEAGTDGTEHPADGSPALEAQAPLCAAAPAPAPAAKFAAADQHDDVIIAAVIDEAKPAAEATEVEPHAEEGAAVADIVPLAVASPASPTDNAEAVAPAATVESPAQATVIDFQERQRRRAELVADGPMAVRSRPTRTGRLAAKIAASILLLITAATAMVASDRNAFGMAQSLPWMTQAPSTPTTFMWLLKRFRDGVARASEAGREAWGG